MKRIHLVLLIVLMAIVAGGWYGYREYYRTHEDISDIAPVFSFKTEVLIKAYEADPTAFHQKYADKILAVNGMVKRIDTTENPVVISLDGGGMSSIQCSMDSLHAAQYRYVKEGQPLTVKGMCTDGRTEELFGTDIILSRCVITEKSSTNQ